MHVYLNTDVRDLCNLLGWDVEAFNKYAAAWSATTGQRWRQLLEGRQTDPFTRSLLGPLQGAHCVPVQLGAPVGQELVMRTMYSPYGG